MSAQKEKLTIEKNFDNISFSLRYRPIEELVVLDPDGNSNLADYKKIKEKYSSMHYFTFGIVSKNNNEVMAHNGNEGNEYYYNLDYLINNIQYDFYLVDNTDTIPCSISHYERNYGISPVNNINLSFEKIPNKPLNDLILVYEDKLFDVGIVKFKIDKEVLTNLPELAYENSK